MKIRNLRRLLVLAVLCNLVFVVSILNMVKHKKEVVSNVESKTKQIESQETELTKLREEISNLKNDNDKLKYEIDLYSKIKTLSFDTKTDKVTEKEGLINQVIEVDGKYFKIAKEVDVRESYYNDTHVENGGYAGKTADPNHPYLDNNVVAAPSNVPFGTNILLMRKDGTCDLKQVHDRGGAIVWQGDTMKLDVCVMGATQEELNRMGVKYSKGIFLIPIN